MENARSVSPIKPLDLAYIAGLFDGEGHISIVKMPPSLKWRTKSSHYRLDIGITNTNQDIIYWVNGIFNGRICKRTRSEKWHTCWEWRRSNNGAQEFLEVILPFLKIKRSQAEIVLRFQNEKIDGSKGGRGHVLSINELSKRDLFIEELSKSRFMDYAI